MTVKQKNRVFIGVIVFLVILLGVSVFSFASKSKALNTAEAQISEKNATISEQKQVNSSLEEQLRKSEEERSAIKSELDSTKKAKEGLESENSQLKKTITELKAKKESVKPVEIPQNPMPNGRVCYLTFDDGPTANTLKILEILDRYNIKATFFVVDNAYTKIEYTKQVAAAGHSIGLHTASHIYSQIYKSTDNYFADLNIISEKVKHYTGGYSKLLRFPGGSSNGVSKQYNRGIMTVLSQKVTEKGYTYFDWNVDSGDASGNLSASKIAANVLQQSENKNSICVLMHDSADKTTTVEALSGIIEGLKNQGYIFEALTPQSHGYHHQIHN